MDSISMDFTPISRGIAKEGEGGGERDLRSEGFKARIGCKRPGLSEIATNNLIAHPRGLQ